MKTPLPSTTGPTPSPGRLVILAALLLGAINAAIAPAQPAPGAAGELKPFRQEIPGTTVAFDMVPVPARAGDKPLPAFWIARCEVTWDEYDAFVFRLDLPDGVPAAEVDAKTHPTKPYLAADHGFGHAGYPALCVAYKGAEAYCKWLSTKTGRKYRLPTEQEWEHACRADGAADLPSDLGDHAWFEANADAKSHPVGTRKPNAWGIHDMLGNVREWATSADGKPVTKGGSYKEPAEDLNPALTVPHKKAWNASDPQIPKSPWWLADGGFIGFRVVCEAETK